MSRPPSEFLLRAPIEVSASTQFSRFVLAFALFFPLLLIGVSGDRLFRDPDTLWHIAVGRRILETRSLPWVDHLSHTFEGHSWIAKEWLSQVLFAAAYETGAWFGVAILSVGAIALTFSLMFGELARRMRPSAALSITMVAYALSLIYFLARPHVLSYPVAVIWLAGVVRAADDRTVPQPYLLLLMVLWANLHGGYTLGLAVAGALAIEAVVESAREDRLKTISRWALFLFAAILATLVTPYGYHSAFVSGTLSILLATVKYATVKYEALTYINEWQPMNFANEVFVGPIILGMLFLALSLGVKIKFMRLAVVMLLFYMMLVHIRLVSVFALVTPFMIASSLLAQFPALSRDPNHKRQENVLGKLLQLLMRPQYALAVLILLAAPSLAALQMRGIAPSSWITPVSAVDHLMRTDPAGRVYNDFGFNGYLIFRGVKTFIDGRTDQLFGGGFLTRVFESHKKPNDDFLKLLDEYQITSALVRPDSDQALKLEAAPYWRREYTDTVATVYKRLGP